MEEGTSEKRRRPEDPSNEDGQPPPPRTGIPYFPYSPEQWPVQWVLRTIAQK